MTDCEIWVQKIEFTDDSAEVTFQVRTEGQAWPAFSERIPADPQGESDDRLSQLAFARLRQRFAGLAACTCFTFGQSQ